MTADIHYMFLIASHMGFFSFVFGIVVRCVVGPLPFVVVFLLVQALIISAYLAIGVFNVSALIQFSLILNLK